MTAALSPRLAMILDALPLSPGMRVLEIGCGPGALVRAIAERVGDGFVLALDRSPAALAQLRASSSALIERRVLGVRLGAIEDFALGADEDPFDLAVAVRVGALDGRYPRAGARALQRLGAALRPSGRLFIDGGDPLREVNVPRS